MAEQKNQEGSTAAGEQQVPAGQKLFDNIFLWLILSFLISGILYNVWGLVEVLGVPQLTR